MGTTWVDRKGELLDAINAETDYPSGSKMEKLRELLTASKSWELAKKKGCSVLPAGEAQGKAKTLLAELAKCGIHVVPVGELESWDQTIGANKETWLGEVLKKDLETGKEFAEARAFVQAVTGL
jgi:hypothetical protein